jgi:phenylacetate-CoA ligase
VTRTHQLYSKLPVGAQSVAISGQGLKFALTRNHSRKTLKEMTFLMKSQWWSEDEFRDYQNFQLRSMMAYCLEEVPFYRSLARELDFCSEDFRNVEEFENFPILQKSSIRGNEEAFISDNFDKRKLLVAGTSGTTGTPMKILFDRSSFARRWGFVARLRSVAGVDPIRPRRCQFTGRDLTTENQSPYWRYNYPDNALLMSTSHISAGSVSDYIDAMKAWNPELIDGYPSALLALVRTAREARISLPRPIAIITSAESLFPSDREEIERGFGCQVFDQYASSEPSTFWADCEFGKMHIAEEFGISEVLDQDGKPVRPGEPGRIITSAFVGSPMNLLRYDIGDQAVVATTRHCECGRRSRIIDSVLGRVDDVLTIPGRGYVGRLDPAFKGLHGIIETQIAQTSLTRIEVRIVPAADFTQEIQDELLTNLRAKLGDQVVIDFVLRESLPRSANGKFRAVVREIPAESFRLS